LSYIVQNGLIADQKPVSAQMQAKNMELKMLLFSRAVINSGPCQDPDMLSRPLA
jgi:hypothetical protein